MFLCYHLFTFVSVDVHLLCGNNVCQNNVDVIGRLAWCGDLEIFKFRGKESKRMHLDLEDYEYVNIPSQFIYLTAVLSECFIKCVSIKYM